MPRGKYFDRVVKSQPLLYILHAQTLSYNFVFLYFVPLSQCLHPLHRCISRLRCTQQTQVVGATCQDSPFCHPPLSFHPHHLTLSLLPALWRIQPNKELHQVMETSAPKAERQITSSDGMLVSDQSKPNMKPQAQNTQI